MSGIHVARTQLLFEGSDTDVRRYAGFSRAELVKKDEALRSAPSTLPNRLRNVVEYRKSGLSLNHVVGCPLDCGYCVRHLFQNYDMKRPHLIMDDKSAVSLLVNHPAFRRDLTPIQLFNRATDPFLPGVKDHLFSTLEALDSQQLRNHVLVITRWRIDKEDVVRLEKLADLQITLLITWSGIDDSSIEPVDSAIAEDSLMTLGQHAVRTKKILYWRPLIAGINDTEHHLSRAVELSKYADATVFTGLFYREEIRTHFRSAGLLDFYDKIARRKILPEDTEQRALRAFKNRALFRKTSCGVAFAHGIADYNGHFSIREICDICPARQVDRCAAAHRTPDAATVRALGALAGLDVRDVSVDERRVLVSGSTEEQRYFIQHALNYQVHDRAHPHLPRRHGRAEVGWP